MTLEKLQVIIQAKTDEYMDSMKKIQQQTANTTKKVESYVEKIKSAFGNKGMTLEKLQSNVRKNTQKYTESMQKIQQQTANTTKKVEAQVGKIKSAFGKIGKVLGIALSVAAIINFGKQCIELGSDLQEVQNVVDVTFGGMSSTIDDFAQNAIEQFGLSELAAKQYSSTMGAMLKSMGFTTQAAADMSMELTGLAGDMASFYNLSGDDAFAKIRAGISGETEPLKQLGINLSVANLEQFALTQGMKKSYSAMTQQEQALLRYNYLLSVTSDAQGDFARTSDSWANQTRILAERFNSLKAAIGQGLINVFTPILRVLNQVIAKLTEAAKAFQRFTEIITGKKSQTNSSMSGVAANTQDATAAMGDLTSATSKAGGAAKKAEEAFHGLAGFDEINSLTKAAEGSGGTESGSVEDMSGFVDETAQETDHELNPVLQKLIDKLKELRDLFKEGFKAGMGDVTLEPLQKAIESIRQSLKNIFTDPGVLSAADNWVNTMAYVMGQVTGSIASIGITIATNLFGGIAKYLEGNQERIKEHIIAMFDISAETATIQGNFAQAVANIFSVFGGENGQQVTANLIGIFADAYMGVNELTAKFSRDVTQMICKPFIDNQEPIKTALDGTLGVVADVLGSIKEVVDSTFDKANEVYDAHLKPLFDDVATGLSSIVGTLVAAYQQYILPVLDGLSTKFSGVMSEHIQPMIDKALEFIGKVADAVRAIWNNALVPFVNWFIQNVAPIISEKLNAIGDVVFTVWGVISDVLGDVFDALGGLMDFITGVFTGDWELAWSGIKDFFGGIWQGILDLLSGIWDIICSVVSGRLSVIQTVIDTVLNTVKTIFSTIFTAIRNTVTTIFSAIKTTISMVITAIQSVISTVLNTIKTIFSTVLTSIKNTVSTIFNAIKSAITTVLDSIKTGVSNALDSVKTTFSTVFTSIKETVTSIFNSMWDTIKSVINSIIGGIETMANAVVNGINTVINALNNLSFTVPDWVPELGGKTFGFNIPTLGTVSLPRLAMGGIVDRATPLIAGEAGKEAIVPLERNTGWMDQVANRLGEMIVTSLNGFFEMFEGGDENWQTITTIVQIDGRTLVEQTDKVRMRNGYRMSHT